MVSQNSSANLQREMQNVRRNLDEHAEEMVQKAKTQFDWRHYVASHPWLALGAAAAAGYFLVPRRACYTIVHHEAVAAPERAASPPESKSPSPVAGFLAGALSVVTATVVREGLNVVSQFAQKMFEPRAEPSPNPEETSGNDRSKDV